MTTKLADGPFTVSITKLDALIKERDQLADALRELIYAHEAGEVTREDWVNARKAIAKVKL